MQYGNISSVQHLNSLRRLSRGEENKNISLYSRTALFQTPIGHEQVSILTGRPHLVLNKVSMGVFISRVNLDYNSGSTHRRYMNKEKKSES